MTLLVAYLYTLFVISLAIALYEGACWIVETVDYILGGRYDD